MAGPRNDIAVTYRFEGNSSHLRLVFPNGGEGGVDGRFKIDNTPNNSEKEPGYEGGQPQTAPPPDPSGCHPQQNIPPNGGETH